MQKIAQRLYWKWEESHLRDPIHWALFLTVGMVVVIHLVTSIATSAVDNGGFGIYYTNMEAAASEQ